MSSHIAHKLIIVATVAVMSSTLVSCASTTATDKPALASNVKDIALTVEGIDTGLAAPPFQVGDVFVYDNPQQRWEVTGISNSSVYWQDGAGGFKKTTWSTLLPTLRWQSPDNAGNRTIEILSGQLHPLRKGNKVSFLESTRRARPAVTFRGRWDCEVQDKVEIVVAAGKADTWQILCVVNGRERVIYNYAEHIGNNVRVIIATDDGKTVTRQLAGYSGHRKNTQAAGKPAN